MYEAFNETCTTDTKLIILVDEDDPTLSSYYTVLNGIGQVTTVTPGRPGMVAALQRGYDHHRESLGYAVGFMGDDHRPRTRGWDELYLSNLREMGTGLVYGDDGYQHEAIPTQVAMTSDIPAALGYMCPPSFDHLCVDVVWNDWGKAIDRIKYLPDVYIEHMHYLAGKSKQDQTYNVANSGEMATHDSQAYQEYKSGDGFNRDVRLLEELIKPKVEYVPNPTKKRPGRPKKAV